MSSTYVTRDGDVLDEICSRQYGVTSGALEAVLLANPGLAELPTELSAGVSIVLTDLQVPVAATQIIRLWS